MKQGKVLYVAQIHKELKQVVTDYVAVAAFDSTTELIDDMTKKLIDGIRRVDSSFDKTIVISMTESDDEDVQFDTYLLNVDHPDSDLIHIATEFKDDEVVLFTEVSRWGEGYSVEKL